MQRISSNMDKLLAHVQRDIRFRKANRKIQYPTPKINPRIAPPVSAQEIRKMKDGLKDEGRNIMQIAFLPEPEEGASGGPRITMPGEDIPDAPGRCREEERRSNLSVNTNSGPTQGAQPCHTDRADRTVNFQNRTAQNQRHKRGTTKPYEHFKFSKYPGSGEQREHSP